MEIMKSIINQDLSDIKSIKDNLFLNCPKCKSTCYLSFNKKYPYNIDINCNNCQNKTDIYLEDYLSSLSNYDPQKVVKCQIHKTFLDKFCYKSHKQFCSRCDMDAHSNCYPIKQIMKVISKERLEEIQKIMDEYKTDFEKYINDFMKHYLTNQPNDTHQFIIESLVLPFIQNMKSFFRFCTYAILNYNVDFPDFYQQMNLKVILSIFNKKVELMELSNNFEYIFNYQDNNYFSKHRVKLALSETKGLNDLFVIDTFHFNNEIKVTNSNDKIRIYKNEECIKTLNKEKFKLNFYKINEDSFAIESKEKESSSVEIFSINFNDRIFYKTFNKSQRFHRCFSLEDNKFGIGSGNIIEIYTVEGQNIQKVSEKSINRYIYDMVAIPNTKYIAVLVNYLGKSQLDLYNKDDLNFIQNISLNSQYNQFYQSNDGIVFLGGYKIAYFDSNNLGVITIRDDGITAFTSGANTEINYSDIIITYFNRIICKKYFYQITGSTYEDAPNTLSANDTTICVLDFDIEKKTSTLIENRKDIYPINLYLSENNEILNSVFNGIQIYNID